MLENDGGAPALFLNGPTREKEGCVFVYTDGASEVFQA
jgi:hypothetical protein